MVAAGAIYCFRCIYSTISLNANKYKETQLGAVLECVVNLVLSLVLVLVANMGLVGIAIGTAMGMLTRYVFDICFLSKNVLNRSVFMALKMLFVSVLIAVLSIAICRVVLPYDAIDSMIRWLLIALATASITAFVAIMVYMIFYRNTVKVLLQKILRKEN